MGRKKSRKAKREAVEAPISPAAPIRRWIRHVLVAAALGIVILLAYSNSFHAGFVVDNKVLILQDPRVREISGMNLKLIFNRSAWWPTLTGLYRPITTLSFLLNYSVFGNAENPEGYHWLNFLLHWFNGVLVYALALRIMRKFWMAVFVATLWAIHPASTEAVTNIIGRSDLLSATAVLGGILIYLKARGATGWRQCRWFAALTAVTAIGVFSKESAVAIVGVILLYEISFWNERAQLRVVFLGVAATAVPVLGMVYARTMIMRAATLPPIFSFVDNPLLGAHFLQARLTAIAIVAKYLWLLIWPVKLSADYSYSQIPISSGTLHDWIAWCSVAAVVLIVARQFSKNRTAFFFGVFAFVVFVPVSNFLLLIGTPMGERFLYLPSVGFTACEVVILYAISDRARLRMLPAIGACTIVALFGIRTWTRNIDWQNDLNLARASIRTAPNSFKSHWSLAVALADSGTVPENISEQVNEVDKSLSILDGLSDSRNVSSIYAGAGGVYTRKGDLLVRRGLDGNRIVPPDAILAYQKSVQILLRGASIDRTQVEYYHQLLRDRGTPSTQISPLGFPLLYTNLATAYLRLGKNQEAYDAAIHARLLNPNLVEPYILMSQALAPQGLKEAAAQALVEGILVSGEEGLLAPLAVLYKYGVDPDACAITRTANGPFLNNRCAKVHAEICSGSAELIRLYRENLRPDLEALAKSKAVGQFDCKEAQLEKH